jgi:hypothetical protein
MSEKEKFYEEIRAFLSELTRQSGQPMDNALLDDLILYESSMIKGPADNSEIEVSLRYDLHGYLFNLADPTNHLRQTPLKLRIKTEKQFVGNLNAYAREIVWYGRKGGHFHHINIARELL